MTRSSKRIGIITALALTGLLAVGVTTASAKGPRGPKGPTASALVTQAATELKVTRADLKAAIVQSARTASTRPSRTRTSRPTRATT